VTLLLRQAEVRATDLLRAHRPELDRVVDLLLQRETIDGSELLAVLGPSAPTAPAAATTGPRRPRWM
jgi:cell division protease FtsH